MLIASAKYDELHVAYILKTGHIWQLYGKYAIFSLVAVRDINPSESTAYLQGE
jgi:hypothetical protein